MNAIQELGEVVKIVDKGERVVAFAAWLSKWVDQGFVEGELAPGADAADRTAFEQAGFGELLAQLARQSDGVMQVVDQGGGRVQLRVVMLRAVPHEQKAAVPPASGFLS